MDKKDNEMLLNLIANPFKTKKNYKKISVIENKDELLYSCLRENYKQFDITLKQYEIIKQIIKEYLDTNEIHNILTNIIYNIEINNN
jgi:hypothetical protein